MTSHIKAIRECHKKIQQKTKKVKRIRTCSLVSLATALVAYGLGKFWTNGIDNQQNKPHTPKPVFRRSAYYSDLNYTNENNIKESNGCSILDTANGRLMYCEGSTDVSKGCESLGFTRAPFIEKVNHNVMLMRQPWYNWVNQVNPSIVGKHPYTYKGPEMSIFGYSCPDQNQLAYIQNKKYHVVEGTSTCGKMNQEETTVFFKNEVRSYYPNSEMKALFYLSLNGDKLKQSELYSVLKTNYALSAEDKPDYSNDRTLLLTLNHLKQYDFDGLFIDHIGSVTNSKEILEKLDLSTFPTIMIATLEYKIFPGRLITFWEHAGYFENQATLTDIFNIAKNYNETKQFVIADFPAPYLTLQENDAWPVHNVDPSVSGEKQFLKTLAQWENTTQLCKN